MDKIKSFDWRDILARLPLPMLALSASWGVYQFSMLYTPQWVAIAQAAAFEATYLGLSAQSSLSDTQRQRARVISLGAVCVSVIYNSLAGYFYRNPDTLLHAPFVLEIVLAALHGAPLAIVAYAVSDLLLHTERKESIKTVENDTLDTMLPVPSIDPALFDYFYNTTRLSPDTPEQESVSDGALDDTDKLELARKLRQEGKSWREVARIVGMSDATLRRRLATLDEVA
jgi:hypothetical protein